MQVKIYVPTTVEIPGEYLTALAQRAHDALGNAGSEVAATRGHLVRQAVADGLLRELDSLMGEDGVVDTFCDPHGEIPLEINNRTVTLAELLETLQGQKNGTVAKQAEEISKFHGKGKQDGVIPMKRAA